MKKLILFAATTALAILHFNSQAQQSCSFIIHVDGVSGIDDVACGAEGTPCATINYGIDRAVTEGYSTVRITASSYVEVIELVDGVSLWGGFDAQWAASGVTTITGGMAGNGEFYAVRADAINTPTVLSDLDITAPNATNPGKSSYGVHVTNSTALTLQRVTVRGGIGANGTSGVAGASATTPGANGLSGGNAREYSTTCNDSDSGAGGAGVGAGNRRGGNGGRGGYMDKKCSSFNLDATPGISGENATSFATSGYGYRGNGGGTCANGGNANNGQTVHGAGGIGAASSANVIGVFWEALAGVNGTLGEDGTGGGGGGGSGGCDTGTDSYGAGGGGGGEGGLKASSAGTGGLSGGNSAAVFMLTSTCNFIDCNFFIGIGGNGANGGNSGTGSAGGFGGAGGAGDGDSGPGGNGGNGGAGGNSGAGGGGAGGSAYGIYYDSNSVIYRTGSTFNPGIGGLAGVGGTGTPSGLEGANGQIGSSSDIAGTGTDNVGVLASEEDPCIEVTIVDLTTLTYCAGDSISVQYTAVGSFTGTNTFTAQLSDASGDFASPTDIGSVVSDVSGVVPVSIPTTTVDGTGYRIRVTSSASPSIGMENATDIVINALPAVVATASTQNVCAGSEVTLTGGGADLYVWNNDVTDGVAFTPTQSGYFTVYGVNAATLCANADSVEIMVLDLPDTSVVQNGNELGAVLAGATYQWVDCDDNHAIIPGADAQTYAAPNSGNYAVVVTQNGCSDTSSCYSVITVGLEQAMEAAHVLIVYPNPSTGVLRTLTDVENPMDVSVFNTMGQMVYSKANVTANEVIDLSGFTNGLYSVRFHNKEVNLLRQVIIQK